ncbi:MAG: hypothetical protein ABIU63_09110 [Chitinophagaceae bacterium]
MKTLIVLKRPVAAFMLFIFACNLLAPVTAYALTGGPEQPEMKGFEPAGNNNLVDLFSGDLTYNIPLMEVGGYPVNLAYHSGSGMDDEASWVGFGWSLNPGTVDRQLRGLPDDFTGAGAEGDKIVKEFHVRNDITGGINLSFNPEIFGFDIGKLAKASVQAGIFYNNKRGLGIEFGLDLNAPLLSSSKNTAGTNTAGLAAKASLNFNSQTGASFNPSLNLAISSKQLTGSEKNAGISLGAAMNSRTGLQYTTLGASYNSTKRAQGKRDVIQNSTASYTSYAAQTFLPETQADYFNQSYALSPQLGGSAWGLFPAVQLSGHYSIQKVAHPVTSYNAYGFMHGHESKNDNMALMDFNREKEVPYFDGVPNLPVPVATPDLFMATAQDGSGQYRAYTGSTGIFSDHDAFNTSVSAAAGVEIGFGAGFKTGADLQASLSKTSTTKWKTGDNFLYRDENGYNAYGNFTGPREVADPAYEPVYFKRVGEQVPDDENVFQEINGKVPVRIKTAGSGVGAAALPVLLAKNNIATAVKKNIHRTSRAVRNNSFSYLTTEQVGKAGLNKTINDYYLAAGGFKPFLNNCTGVRNLVLQPYKKNHHIGEITITDEGGARKVYGIPAYNTYQEDVSFSVPRQQHEADKIKGLVSYTTQDASANNKNGTDHFYSKEITPGYAHSFLLTGVLSPDYVDLKGDGITDDDAGTAVKFNYWRKTDQFQWRTPYAAGKANYNEGLTSDNMDDRGNYSYGRKELWYVHSIESKTMVAIFETADREDAMGADAMGNKDIAGGNRQQYLKTIRLYSKADWYKNADAATPVKTAHFVYDYSLFADAVDVIGGVPNNSGHPVTAGESVLANQGGKLTLKQVYFTYQDNTKGSLQPYEFAYDSNGPYNWKQYDRWGNYKNESDGNPAGINNDYYSYSTQDKTKADANAARWQLTQIQTPAGGLVKVEYESDDYSYVQNKKAMQMYPMSGAGDRQGSGKGYYEGDKIYVQLPQALASDAELRAKYFDGGDNDDNKNLFFKARVKLKSNEEKYDYVAGYAEIADIGKDVHLAAGSNDIAEIRVRKIKGDGVSKTYHPIAKAAWQFMRLNTPALVYPGYNVSESLGPVQFVKALIGAISSVGELLSPFDTRAEIKQLAPEIDLSKSWVRLGAATNDTKKLNGISYYAKLGGGLRVKEVSVSDQWNDMSQSDAESATYGMVYDYSTIITLANGEKVTASSGVASYEPMIGNEENPFHQPSAYNQKIKLGPDNAFFIDEPLCESYFPSPSVGYSSVTVRNRGADGALGATGYSVSEFYTAKDFPTIVDHTPIDVQPFGGSNILQFLKIKKNNSRVVSQGYSIELNDMHGKLKAEKIMGKGENEISAVYYYYKTVNQDATDKKLNNEALVLREDGSTGNAVIGRELEMYSDMRSQTSFTAGLNVMLNIDAIYLLFAVIPIPTILPLPNASYTGFRSACTIKIIHQYGLLDRIIKRQQGSQVTTENLAWDADTGEVILTRTQNEFDDPVYNINYPAHWMYGDGMGPAYKNIGLVITGLTVIGGLISVSAATQLLVSGDELLVKNNANIFKKYWVNKAGMGVNDKLVLIDEDGIPATLFGVNAVVTRSGRRNMPGAAAGAMVSLVNPIKNGKLSISSLTQVLDANGTEYSDEWAIEAKNILRAVLVCPNGFSTDAAGRCYKDTVVVTDPAYAVNTTAIRQKNNSYATCGTYITNDVNAYLSLGSAGEPRTAQKIPVINGIWQNGISACNTGAGTSGEYDGPLNRSGIWLTEKKNNNYTQNEWVGIKSTVYISPSQVANKSADGKTGTLLLGFGAYNNIEVSIDNVIVAARGANNNNVSSPYRTWHIKPVTLQLDPRNPLKEQPHDIFIRVRSQGTVSEGVIGVELYNNKQAELLDATCIRESCLPCTACDACRVTTGAGVGPLASCISAKIIWSTKCLEGKRFTYHANLAGRLLPDFNPVCTNGEMFTDDNCNSKCRVTQRVYADKVSSSSCEPPVGKTINPYVTGLRGNWRIQKSFVYHTDRSSLLPAVKPGDPDVIEKTDIRKSGAYTEFSPFWEYEGNKWLPAEQQTRSDLNWVKGNEMTAYNQKGLETENKDALNRYSAVQFGYLQSVATAVAANARYTDIAYDGFEDYGFNLDNCQSADSCNIAGHFSIQQMIRKYPGAISTDATYAHTGRNALRVNGGANAVISQSIIPVTSTTLYSFTGAAMSITDKALLSGFKPQPGRKYLLSTWVRDIAPVPVEPGVDESQNVQLYVSNEAGKAAVEVLSGNTIIAQTLRAGPRIEQWRKVETVFIIPPGAQHIQVRFRPGSSPAYFDDIRVQPFDAQMKTYAYDNRTMRLWAALDENNFATFYEYDDEGVLIRTKKETERGIMTINETRQSLRIKK